MLRRVLYGFSLFALASVCWGQQPELKSAYDARLKNIAATMMQTNPLFSVSTISSTNYIVPFYQMRLNAIALNPPLMFDVGGSAGTQKIFQVVGTTVANTYTAAVTAPGQATVVTFPDPALSTATIPYLEAAQTFSGANTFSASNTFTVFQTFSATTNQIKAGAASHLDILSFTAPAAATQTITFPDSATNPTVPYAVFTDCGNNTACSPTTVSSTVKITKGICTASSATTCTVTAISPAYASNTSYVCNVTDGTTAANNALKITYVSGSSFTVTTTSSSDAFSYVCVGT